MKPNVRGAAALALLLVSAFAAVRPARGADTREELAAVVRDGDVSLEVALDDGRAPLGYGYALETRGLPLLALEARAKDGQVLSFCANVPAGSLVLRGAGLRPNIRIEELEIGEGGVVKTARYRGEGGWSRFVLALASGLAKKELARLRFRTEIAALMKGELFVPAEAAKEKKGAPATASAPTATPSTDAGREPKAASAAAPGAQAAPSPADAFLRLVDHVRLEHTSVTAFGGRALAFGDAFHLTTGTARPLELRIDEALYRPEAATGVSAYRVSGALDGAFAEGGLLWEDDRLAFSSGLLDGGRFLMEDGFASRAEIGASRLSLELSSGRFNLPSGIHVELQAPSRFSARDFATGAAGTHALVDLDISGKTGEIVREGSRIELTSAHVTTAGLKLAHGQADGDLDVAFEYHLVHALALTYPVPELKPRRVDLAFHGPFRAKLHLANLGAGTKDSVTGTYVFAVDWPPIEKAAFEVIRAQWVQDVKPLRKVRFEIEPVQFAPCGEECFVARFTFAAAKVGSKTLSIRCAPEGQATLVVDKAARAFVLKGVKTEPKCEGLLGKLVNLVAPLFTKTYDDMVLFRMPDGLPFTIEHVKGDGANLEISGAVAWKEATSP